MRIANMSNFENKVFSEVLDHTHMHTPHVCSLSSLVFRHLVLIRVDIISLGLVDHFFFYLYLCSVLHYVVNVRVIFHPDLNHLEQPGCVAIKITWTLTILQIKDGRIYLEMADISNVSSLQCLWVWRWRVGGKFSSERADIEVLKSKG